MLVIGFNAEKNTHTVRDLDVDIDSPDKVYKVLKATSKGEDFTLIVCIEDGEEVAGFLVHEDFDPEDIEEEEDELTEDENMDEDNLHDVDEDDE